MEKYNSCVSIGFVREYKQANGEHFDTVHQAEQDLIALKRVVFGDSRAPEAPEKQHDDFY
jgi:hypothetical protein